MTGATRRGATTSARAVLLVIVAAASAGCPSGNGGHPIDPWPDLSVAIPPVIDGGTGPAIFAEVSFASCPGFGVDGGRPHCAGAAPLEVTLVPLAPSVSADGGSPYTWALPGSDTPSSTQRSPSVKWANPGSYIVMLVVRGAGGEASATAGVEVSAIGTGGPCTDDKQCSAGLGCACAPPGSAPDLGVVACPDALAGGLCTTTCIGGGCGAAASCVDLSLSIAGDPIAATQQYRRAICLPGCAGDADCRAGFACRELPVLVDGASQGGAYTWGRACFAATVLGDVGRSCLGVDGKLSSSSCIGGLCVAMGARGSCAARCEMLPCPASASCATFNSDPIHPLCVVRCDRAHPCTDPLLACQPPDQKGFWGYTLPQNDGSYCVPRSCTMPADCAPAGVCTAFSGGLSFCAP